MIENTTQSTRPTMFGLRTASFALLGVAAMSLVAPAIQGLFSVPMSSLVPIATWSVFGAMQAVLVLVAAAGVLGWARSRSTVIQTVAARELTETEQLQVELQTSAPIDSSEIVETQTA
ncbi:MAG: hypothetical protein AAGI30_12145 [Planctomycetota bacterium]